MSGAALITGFYGKLPARGDFVRAGLPRDFTDPWDAWLQSVLAGSRSIMGEAWLPAFLEAPVWRFALPAGMCGSHAALGVMLPSVDRAGRYFPLTFAALSPHGIATEAGEAWLDTCEDVGRAALESDPSPQEISDAISGHDLSLISIPTENAVWWTEGSMRVTPMRMVLHSLPDAATYADMLGAKHEGTNVDDIGGRQTRRESTA